MESFEVVLEFISFLLALLAGSILMWVNKEQHHTNRMLALLLFILSVHNLFCVLIYSKVILQFPWLYRTATPTTLLIAPTAYIYVRSILLGELKFRKRDWMLLIPAVLAVINFMQFYIMPIEEKRQLLTVLLNSRSLHTSSNEGILPILMYAILRIAWSTIFIVLNYQLINRFKKQMSLQALNDNKDLLKWLYTLNGLLVGILITALLFIFIAPIFKTNFSLVDLFFSMTVIVICFHLFIRPKLLYGVFLPHHVLLQMELANTVTEDNLIRSSLTSEHEITLVMDQDVLQEFAIKDKEGIKYKLQLEVFFIEKRPFLQVDYSLEKLVIDLKIPRYIISAFINQEYGIGFREFLNRYRVDFFKANLENPSWKNLTLEAIAEECGFISRSTFIKNFKQISGQTPSEYIKNS